MRYRPRGQLKKRQGNTRIVVLGAGFGGAYTFRALHSQLHGDPGVELILVNRNNYFLFTPLLHEVATGGVAPNLVTEPLRRVLGCCLQDLHLSDVSAIDLNEQVVMVGTGRLKYDFLAIALGATTDYFGVPGAREYSFSLKTLPDALRLKNHVVGKFEAATKELNQEKRTHMLRFVVIGGGPTGVEVAAELADLCLGTFAKYYKRSPLIHDVEIVLIESGSLLMSSMPHKLGETSLRVLRSKGVAVRLDTRVVQVGEQFVELASGERLAAETAIWVAGVKPQPLEVAGKAARDDRGRLIVNESLQLPVHPNVFVLGDMAHFENSDEKGAVPALAQVASKQGPAVAKNIVRLHRGQDVQTYTYRDAGQLVSLGQWMAVANIRKVFFTGRFAWWLWRTVYLFKLLSVRKKVKVAVDWTFDMLEPRDISQV